MQLEERSYSGRSFRPRPLIEDIPARNTLIVATSWGGPEHAQSVIEMIKEQITLHSNPESTRLGNYIAELSEDGNILRAAALYANEQLYLKENVQEYNTAVEVAIISVQNHVLSWVQMGSPHLILKTRKSGADPLASSPDWAWQLQQDSPLVFKALGLERNCYPNCGSYRLMGGEKLVMVSRSAVAPRLYGLEQMNLQTCGQVLVEDHAEAPFWLGVLDL